MGGPCRGACIGKCSAAGAPGSAGVRRPAGAHLFPGNCQSWYSGVEAVSVQPTVERKPFNGTGKGIIEWHAFDQALAVSSGHPTVLICSLHTHNSQNLVAYAENSCLHRSINQTHNVAKLVMFSLCA